MSTILISIQSLLGEPNNRSPLNVEAADLWDDVEGVRPSPTSPPFERAGSWLDETTLTIEQFKKELAKHYRPIDEDA